MRSILNVLFISSIFSFIFSCRQVPDEERITDEDILLNSPVSVKITFSGIEYEKNNPNNTLISENNTEGRGGNSLKNNKLEENTYYGDFISTEVETIPEIPENNEYIASLGLEAARNAGNLSTEAVYVILAYRKVGNTYIFHKKQTFSIERKNHKIELDCEKNYTLIIVSTGTKELPNIANEKDINNVRFITSGYRDSNVKFLYQKREDFKPKLNESINVKLKGLTSISVVVDTSKMLAGDNGARITKLENAIIKYTRPKAIKLGNITGLEYEEVTLLPKNQEFADDKHTSYRIDFNDAILVNQQTVKLFIETIHVEGHPTDGKIDGLALSIKPGYKYTSVLSPVICGGYLGPNKTNFREFMCHELGKNFSDGKPKPITTYGDMYIWGTKVTTASNYPPVNYPYEKGNVWKEENNPCPKGFRVPSKVEWDGLLNPNYNQMKWTGSILKIGNRLSLFSRNWFWTSTPKDAHNSYQVVLDGGIYKGYTYHKKYGRSIRCIRKLPDEQ